MNYNKVLPETELISVDVLKTDGAFNVGCYVEDGKLKPGFNNVIKKNSIAGYVTVAWFAEGSKNNIYCSTDSTVSFTKTDSYYVSGKKMTATRHSFFETNEAGIPDSIVVGTASYMKINSKYTLYDYDGNVRSCVLKNGRVFGIDNTDPNKIKWSGEGGIDDWTESISGAGWVVLQNGLGEILNLVVYKDKIVILREFGLAFLSAYGNPENYKLSYTERKLPKIFANTAAVAGDKLYFYTENGLYFYDGTKAEKSDIPLTDELLDADTVFTRNGKFYLAGNSKKLERRVVLVTDVIQNYAYIIDFPAEAVCIGSLDFAYLGGWEYFMYDDGEYSFTSGEIDFSREGKKVLKEVKINSANGVRIEVSNGVISRILGGVRGKFCPNMRGNSFKITVFGSGQINKITAVAEVASEL